MAFQKVLQSFQWPRPMEGGMDQLKRKEDWLSVRAVVINELPYCKRVSIIASANCDSISYNQRKDPGTSFQSESFCFKLKEIGFLFSSFDVTKNLAPLAFLISVNSNVLVSFPTAICLLNLSTYLVFMIREKK